MRTLFMKAFWSWWESDSFSKSAAVAYYSIFSFPGLLIIIMGMAAIFFDRASVEAQAIGHIREVLGYDIAFNIDHIIDETQRKDRDIWALVIGFATLLVGAGGVFGQLQKALNDIWEVKVKKRAAWLEFLKHRATAFGIILAIGFLLTVSLAITALLTALGDWVAGQMPVYALYGVHLVNFLLSYCMITFLFTLIFKILPDVHLPWRTSLAGGAVSTVLFVIGEYGVHTYFKIFEPASTFGAAGSLILLMLWVFYSCLILLLGAHFTKACAEVESLRVTPTKIAKTA
jgi:membrane protein